MTEHSPSKEQATTPTNGINEMNSNNKTRQATPKPSSKTRLLLDRAVDAMAALHRAFEPMEDVDGIPAMVSPEAVRTFVDTLAEIDYQRCRLGDDVPPDESLDRRLDRAYYNGAQQAASMAHQSLTAMDDWIASGCGGRGPVTKEESQ